MRLSRLRRKLGEQKEAWGGSEGWPGMLRLRWLRKLGEAQRRIMEAREAQKKAQKEAFGRLRKRLGEAQKDAWRCSGGSKICVAERVDDSGF